MKFTKLLPLIMAATLSLPALADPPSATQTLQLNFPDFMEITADGTQPTSAVTFGPDYSTITVTNALNGGFKVVSNYHSSTLTLSAAAPTSSGTPAAMYSSDGTTAKLVFVFTNSSQAPGSDSVTNITGKTSTSPELNPNAIAYDFNATESFTADSGPSGTITKNVVGNTVTYKIGNGIFNFDYDMATKNTPVANTFSTMDEAGSYQCLLTLTRTGA